MIDDRIAQFVAARDAVLMRGDVDEVVAFLRLHNPGIGVPSSRETALIMMHKAISAATSLPVAYRRASAHWLRRRGYRSFDDGDL